MSAVEKNNLHQRNRHRSRYDFPSLIKALPELAEVVYVNNHNDESIDFADPESVKLLNKAILKSRTEVLDIATPKLRFNDEEGFVLPLQSTINF